MSSVTVHVEEDLAVLLQNSHQSIERTARELIILELYRRGTISSGKASQLLGIGRFEFIQHASRLGIAFLDMTDNEWEAERAQVDLL